MITRRRILVTAAATLITARTSTAQGPKAIPRVGYLSVATTERDKEWVEAFRTGLKEHGYIEGKNIIVDVRHAGGVQDRLPAVASELLRTKVDVVVVYGLPAINAVREAAPRIPIVMTISADPARLGLVESLARPGGQVTGFSDLHSGMAGKRLQMLKEVVPDISRVAVVINDGAKHLLAQLDELKAAGTKFGISILPMPLRSSEHAEIKRAYAALGSARPGALMVIPDGTVDRHSIAAFCTAHRLPSIGTVKEWAEAGFLISYGTSFADLWRRSAAYVDKILKGAKPGDLPIEQPTKFELVLNMKTARSLRLKIPQSILVQASTIIE